MKGDREVAQDGDYGQVQTVIKESLEWGKVVSISEKDSSQRGLENKRKGYKIAINILLFLLSFIIITIIITSNIY